jgi:protein-S-isoprenylcysteine O-methyltransferase Ste14
MSQNRTSLITRAVPVLQPENSMTQIGQFLFRYRNVLGPVLFLVAMALSLPVYAVIAPQWGGAFLAAGVLIAVLGQLLRMVTIGYEYIVRGGKNKQAYASNLVQGGVFAHCRNPLYVGNILVAVGLALIVHSYAFILIVIPAILVTYACIVAAEESYLLGKFGGEYADYMQRVRRWLPRLSGFGESTAGMRFNWKRVLVKEYNTTFTLLAAMLALYWWSKFSAGGASELPSGPAIGEIFVAWVTLYLGVRALKKSGYVKG